MRNQMKDAFENVADSEEKQSLNNNTILCITMHPYTYYLSVHILLQHE